MARQKSVTSMNSTLFAHVCMSCWCALPCSKSHAKMVALVDFQVKPEAEEATLRPICSLTQISFRVRAFKHLGDHWTSKLQSCQ